MPLTQQKPQVPYLDPPERPRILARFSKIPSPEALLALGARVEETALHVGRWRGAGAKTVRYVLELPEEQAVEYRGQTLSALTLKVAPSGKASVEETARHQGALYADLVEASRPLWDLDPELTREVGELAPRLLGDMPARRRVYAFNGLLLAAFRLKHRADVHTPLARLHPGMPLPISSNRWREFAPHLDPGRTWAGTRERVLAGRTWEETELGPEYTLYEEGELRFAFAENRAQGPGISVRAGMLTELLEGRRLDPRHVEAGLRYPWFGFDDLTEAVTDLGTVLERDPEELADAIEAVEKDLSPALRERVLPRGAAFYRDERSPLYAELIRDVLAGGAFLVVSTEYLRNGVRLLKNRGLRSRKLASLEGEIEEALEAFHALAHALGVKPRSWAVFGRIYLDMPSGPARGYLDPAPS